MMYEVLHSGVLGGMTWIPLALWGVDETVDRRDWRPLWKVAAASALSFLAGYPAAWIVSCVIIAAYAVESRKWRAAAATCAALAASVLLFMVQLLPAMDARSFMVLNRSTARGLSARAPCCAPTSCQTGSTSIRFMTRATIPVALMCFAVCRRHRL